MICLLGLITNTYSQTAARIISARALFWQRECQERSLQCNLPAFQGGFCLWGSIFLLPRSSVGSASAPSPTVIWKFSAFGWRSWELFYWGGRGYVWKPSFCQWGWWPDNLWFEVGRGEGVICPAPVFLTDRWSFFLFWIPWNDSGCICRCRHSGVIV